MGRRLQAHSICLQGEFQVTTVVLDLTKHDNVVKIPDTSTSTLKSTLILGSRKFMTLP